MNILKKTAVVIILPAIVLIAVNAYKSYKDNRIEPFADNLLMYVVLAIIFFAAAMVALIAEQMLLNAKSRVLRFVATLVGAIAGSTALLLTLDYGDEYFTGPGVGWIPALTGMVLGGLYGSVLALWQGARAQESAGG